MVTASRVDLGEWDAQAAALGGGYYHCHAQAVCDATRTGNDPLFVKALDESGACVGLVTGTMSGPGVWPFSRYCGSATLYGLPATADGSAEAGRAFMAAMERALRREGAQAVTVLGYDSPDGEAILGGLGYALSPRTEFYVDLARSEEEMWSGLKGERRTDIRKARKLGVETRLENTGEALDLVFNFYDESMRRHGIDLGETREDTARARRERLGGGRIDVFVSYREGEPVNGAIFGNFNGKPYYLVSGSSPAGYKCCGPAHLLWTAMTTYRERGARYLNLGAALEDQVSLYRFKRDFGGTAVAQPMGRKRLSAFGACLNRAVGLLRGR